MAMYHKRVSAAPHLGPFLIGWGRGECWGRATGRGEGQRWWLRCFFETSFSGIRFKLFGCLVRPRGVQAFLRGFGFFGFGVNRGGVSGHRFPRVSVLHDALGNGVKIEGFWSFNRRQFFPLQRSRNWRAGEASNAVWRNNGLRLAIAINIQQDLAMTVLFLDL